MWKYATRGFLTIVLCALVVAPSHARQMVTSFYGTGWPGVAAHKTLRFGTRIKVTNPDNGRSVILRIGDRGPFIAGRELDIPTSAARYLGITRVGVASLEVDILP